MLNKYNSRIRDVRKYLSPLVGDCENFYVGIFYDDFVKSANLNKYQLDPELIKCSEIKPAPKGSVTKSNSHGKYVRKQPEEKTEKIVHIEYTRKDRTHVEYDRIYNVYVKELAHRFNLNLKFVTNSLGQNIIVTDLLVFNNNPLDLEKSKHAINMFLEIFGNFEIFDQYYQPAIHFDRTFEEKLLPSGKLTDKNILDELFYFAKRCHNDNEKTEAFQKRIHAIMKFEPDLKEKGPDGFRGYLVFGFSDLGIVLLESMYLGNATYVFNITNYEKQILKDKQSILTNKLALKRFCHHDGWHNKITNYLIQLRSSVA